MFGNPVLVQGFGVSWTLVKCFAVAGAVLMGVGAVTFLVLVRHLKVQSYRMTPQQALQMMMDPGTTWASTGDSFPSTMTMRGQAVGVGIKMAFTIDSLRNAGRRGDWLTFWSAPIMGCSWFIGVWAVLMATLIRLNVPSIVQIVTTVFVGVMVAVAVFIPWAAIYTEIDLGTDSAGAAPNGGSGTAADAAATGGAPSAPVFTPTVVDPFEPSPAKRRQ